MTIYLDHAATTAVDPRVMDVMLPYFTGQYGNPSSIYGLGQDAARAIDSARDQVAGVLNARNGDIIFTGGGTDSDNMAIRGAAYALRRHGSHVITSASEHHAVIHTCEWLENNAGFSVTYLKPDAEGVISADQVAEAITPETTVVTIMYVNNETGTIQPIPEIAAAIRAAVRLGSAHTCRTAPPNRCATSAAAIQPEGFYAWGTAIYTSLAMINCHRS